MSSFTTLHLLHGKKIYRGREESVDLAWVGYWGWNLFFKGTFSVVYRLAFKFASNIIYRKTTNAWEKNNIFFQSR